MGLGRVWGGNTSSYENHVKVPSHIILKVIPYFLYSSTFLGAGCGPGPLSGSGPAWAGPGPGPWHFLSQLVHIFFVFFLGGLNHAKMKRSNETPPGVLARRLEMKQNIICWKENTSSNGSKIGGVHSRNHRSSQGPHLPAPPPPDPTPFPASLPCPALFSSPILQNVFCISYSSPGVKSERGLNTACGGRAGPGIGKFGG